jgi:hypothetical protein
MGSVSAGSPGSPISGPDNWCNSSWCSRRCRTRGTKLVVSDLHVSLRAEEIHMLVLLRMNHEFMEYLRASYPDTPLSDFKAVDTYVRAHGGVEALDDDDDDE